MCNYFGTMSKNSRASFYGGLIVLFQTSPESANIFRLIHRINVAQDITSLKDSVIGKNGVTEEDFNSFLVYGTGIYTNMGNYKGYGDTKIVPDLKPMHFETIVNCSEAMKNDPQTMERLWAFVRAPMYNLNDKYKQLGMGDQVHIIKDVQFHEKKIFFTKLLIINF